MLVKVSTDKIFWNTIGDNKPSKSYLDTFENRCYEVELKVNQIDFYNITIVCDTTDITYIITNNGIKQYWFFNGVEKILPNGFVLKFQLDIYCTYTLSFFEYLKDNNVKVKLNRSHKLDENNLLYKDELLENTPIYFSELVRGGIQKLDEYNGNWLDFSGGGKVKNLSGQRTIAYATNTNGYSDWYPDKGQYIEGYSVPNTTISNGCYVYIFSFGSNTNTKNSFGRICLIPDFQNNDISFCSKDIPQTVRYSAIDNNFKNDGTFVAEKQNFINNNKEGIYHLINSLPKDNTVFLGMYYIPTFFLFSEKFNKKNMFILKCLVEQQNNTKTITTYLSYFLDTDFTFNTIDTTDTNNFVISKYIDAFKIREQIPSFNYGDKLHRLALKYIDYRVGNLKIDASLFFNETNSSIEFQDWIVGFTQSFYIKPFFKLLRDNENVLQFASNLPTTTDDYAQYVNANKNQRDNSFNIFHKQASLGFVSSIFNGFTDATSNVISGNYGGTITSIFNTGFGLANQILGYNAYVSTLKAQFKDARNALGSSINVGSTDDITNTLYDSRERTPTLKVIYKNLTITTKQLLNNVIYLFGGQCERIDNLTNFTVRTDFNYYLFDSQYLKHILPINIANNVPQEIYPYIIQQLSEGVRIWNTQPSN